tara:strand:- start:3114 stop:3356 length:243 start_codon:yes stop_codon:yes gene_type:complete
LSALQLVEGISNDASSSSVDDWSSLVQKCLAYDRQNYPADPADPADPQNERPAFLRKKDAEKVGMDESMVEDDIAAQASC